jgi:two-component system alkaline phosphatase synthesis response regulator PhoP
MPKILLVDDETTILKMYGDCLTTAGMEVETAKNGDEGVSKAKSGKPDLILLDIMMPSLNGLDALKELKSDPSTRNIPVYLLTNLPESASGDKPKELEANGYLVKVEIEPKKLIEIVNEALKK